MRKLNWGLTEGSLPSRPSAVARIGNPQAGRRVNRSVPLAINNRRSSKLTICATMRAYGPARWTDWPSTPGGCSTRGYQRVPFGDKLWLAPLPARWSELKAGAITPGCSIKAEFAEQDRTLLRSGGSATKMCVCVGLNRFRITRTQTGEFEPQIRPDGRRWEGEGFRLWALGFGKLFNRNAEIFSTANDAKYANRK